MRRPKSDQPGGAAQPGATDAVAAVEHEFAFLVRALEAVQRLRDYPLERAHYLTLRLIEDDGPQPIAAIAARLLLDDSTVTRQVGEMERLQLVEKHPNPADRRSTLVRATRHGRELARGMRSMRLTRVAALMEGWSEAERAQFAELLGRVNRSLIDVVRG